MINLLSEKERAEKQKTTPINGNRSDTLRPIPSIYTEDFWENLDNMFERTINYAERSFKINLVNNVIVTLTGMVLVLFSVYHSWFNGLNLYSVTFGSLGILTFIIMFYIAPQKRVQEFVGDLTQIQLFYRTYCIQWEHIADWQRENRNEMTIDDLRELNKQLEDLTVNINSNIEELIGTEEV
jgi:hypothetical protein